MSARLSRRLLRLGLNARPSGTFLNRPVLRPSLRLSRAVARQGGLHEANRRGTSTSAGPIPHDAPLDESRNVAAGLRACPGCGALAQIVQPGEAGFYSSKRRSVRSYIRSQPVDGGDGSKSREDELVANALENVDPELIESLDLQEATGTATSNAPPAELPLCDRCHDLVHHHTGQSIAHPSIESIQDTIAESPYKYNHIYHVLDAADFPMSLLPNIHHTLSAAFQRSKNRRSKHAGFRHGKKTEISFVITRSDLLAPKKTQVDKMMQYIIGVLRSALGPQGEGVRLGNVRCVSAKRGWWTKELKADIWKRGAGGWMVGKVNVGKSNLYEVVFPKGESQDIDFDSLRNKSRIQSSIPATEDQLLIAQAVDVPERVDLEDENVLLPPARQEERYPTMPTISSLPGTTASPIRIPFGNGRGELVDLPGLARSQLENFVRPEHREDLVMKSRITPEQHTLKAGKSLLLGGLIRITSMDPDVILAYPFVPIKSHLTSTHKAVVLEQEGRRSNSSGVPYIVEENVGSLMTSAGTFQLKWDVSKQRTGPLTSKSAAGLKTSQLPFVVLSTDILIEGVGWVELVAQVRKARGKDEPARIPEVEVFSPEGKCIAARQPMNAWILGGYSTKPGIRTRKQRPRRAMSSARKIPNE